MKAVERLLKFDKEKASKYRYTVNPISICSKKLNFYLVFYSLIRIFAGNNQ